MPQDKNKLYEDAISLLDLIEVSVSDEKNFKLIRKKVLDLANGILRMCDNDG